MKFLLAIVAPLVVIFSCKNEPKIPPATPVKPAITSADFKINEGDCKVNCAEFSVKYPKITTGTDALRDSVQQWVENMVRNYSIRSEVTPTQRVSIDQAGKEFINLWKNDGSELPYSFEMRDTLLAATLNFITLRLDFYTYTGGAHPDYFSELGVFDANTGKMISAKNYIKDETAILPMLDTAYRAEKKEAFADGNEVYDGGQITFPTQCAITESGVLFHYNTYEIGSYALGDADIFLTWTDLGTAAINPFQ